MPGLIVRLDPLWRQPPIGIVEQAELGLQLQHPPHRHIDVSLRNRARPNQIGQVMGIEVAAHAHVDAARERQPRRIPLILGQAVGDQFKVPGVVRDDKALEAPLAAQHILHQPGVGMGRHPRHLIEGRHGRQGARVEGRLEWREMDFAQGPLGHIDAVVVQPPGSGAITGQVFGRRQHGPDVG